MCAIVFRGESDLLMFVDGSGNRTHAVRCRDATQRITLSGGAAVQNTTERFLIFQVHKFCLINNKLSERMLIEEIELYYGKP